MHFSISALLNRVKKYHMLNANKLQKFSLHLLTIIINSNFKKSKQETKLILTLFCILKKKNHYV